MTSTTRRTKTVFSDNYEVAHVWASMAQDEGRSSNGNISFFGRRLYSYSTCIAVIVDAPDGSGPVVIQATHNYSMTTSSKHYPAMRSATRHMRTFYVDSVENRTTPAEMRTSFAERIRRAEEHAAQGNNRPNRAKRFGALLGLIASANEFCEFFRLAPFPVPADEDAEKALAEIRERQKQDNARRAEEMAKLARKREREAKAKAKEARSIAERWIRSEELAYGERYTLGYLGYDLMRLTEDGSEIETTRSARVPTEHVKRLAPMILSLVRAGKEWTCDRDIRLGYYRLDRIEKDGTVKVGCHSFPQKEIERVAILLGVEQRETH